MASAHRLARPFGTAKMMSSTKTAAKTSAKSAARAPGVDIEQYLDEIEAAMHIGKKEFEVLVWHVVHSLDTENQFKNLNDFLKQLRDQQQGGSPTELLREQARTMYAEKRLSRTKQYYVATIMLNMLAVIASAVLIMACMFILKGPAIDIYTIVRDVSFTKRIIGWLLHHFIDLMGREQALTLFDIFVHSGKCSLIRSEDFPTSAGYADSLKIGYTTFSMPHTCTGNEDVVAFAKTIYKGPNEIQHIINEVKIAPLPRKYSDVFVNYATYYVAHNPNVLVGVIQLLTNICTYLLTTASGIFAIFVKFGRSASAQSAFDKSIVFMKMPVHIAASVYQTIWDLRSYYLAKYIMHLYTTNKYEDMGKVTIDPDAFNLPGEARVLELISVDYAALHRQLLGIPSYLDAAQRNKDIIGIIEIVNILSSVENASASNSFLSIVKDIIKLKRERFNDDSSYASPTEKKQFNAIYKQLLTKYNWLAQMREQQGGKPTPRRYHRRAAAPTRRSSAKKTK